MDAETREKIDYFVGKLYQVLAENEELIDLETEIVDQGVELSIALTVDVVAERPPNFRPAYPKNKKVTVQDYQKRLTIDDLSLLKGLQIKF